MYLRALEIQGFKSFPDKTRLSFEKNMTAIVGPNGSGKSNISDAILWVMGEQRSKALRGSKMEDVIFGGTEKRSPLGFAQVSLIIDNSTGLLKMDTNEVMITRRYYRSGDSEYSINRETVRLRDVNELLMDTGLGRDGYSIIGQGRIAEIISAKSTDRREIFEEAAGISRFRYRKEEAERKLSRTDENLLRVSDKIDELELQLTPLKKQAEAAKKFIALKEEQKQAEVSLWMETLDKLAQSTKIIEADLAQAEKNRSDAKDEMDRLYNKAENYSQKMHETDIKTESTRELLSQVEATASDGESAIAVLETNIENNVQSILRIQVDLEAQKTHTDELAEQIAEHENRRSEIKARRAEIDAKMAEFMALLQENRSHNDEKERELKELMAQENELSDAITYSKTVISMLSDSAQELMDRETENQGEYVANERKIETATGAHIEFTKQKTEIDEKVAGLTNVIAGYKMRANSRENKVRELSDKHTKLTIDTRSMQSRINMLQDMEKEFEGFSKAVKIVMREASRGTLQGVHGPVANLLSVGEKYALAIETAIGGAMQNIVVESSQIGKRAIEMLKQKDGGRGTFLPLDTIRGKSINRLPQDEDGYMGIASELIDFDRRYSQIFENILGRTVIAETLSDAVRIAKKYNNNFRIVTLDGQLINAGGSMTGGSNARGTGILSRANELARLTERVQTMQNSLATCESELSEARRELAAVTYDLEQATQEHEETKTEQNQISSQVLQNEILINTLNDAKKAIKDEKSSLATRLSENIERTEKTQIELKDYAEKLTDLQAKIAVLGEGREEFESARRELDEKISSIREQIASAEAEADARQKTIDQMTQLRDNILGANGDRVDTIADIQSKSEDLQLQLAEKRKKQTEIIARINEIKQRIADSISQRMSLEGQRIQAEKAGKDKNNDLIDAERLVAKFEQKKYASSVEENQIIDKLWDNYELSHTAAQKLREPVEDMAELQKTIASIKRAVSSLGTPNIGAIEEFERVNERYTFLEEQRADVEKAKNELLKIIGDITKEMTEIFAEAFKMIDSSFRQTFLELFGGGRAALILEDPDNILECGIEIKVQPPGKALSTISLMSGGEKSFVAIALYFAIIKVRPTPFCVMDEIEAALDDANVIRYAEYMRSLATKTQFVAITHRRGTMEQADILYGVTMQEKGVSKVIEMDVQEAERALA